MNFAIVIVLSGKGEPCIDIPVGPKHVEVGSRDNILSLTTDFPEPAGP